MSDVLYTVTLVLFKVIEQNKQSKAFIKKKHNLTRILSIFNVASAVFEEID